MISINTKFIIFCMAFELASYYPLAFDPASNLILKELAFPLASTSLSIITLSPTSLSATPSQSSGINS